MNAQLKERRNVEGTAVVAFEVIRNSFTSATSRPQLSASDHKVPRIDKE